MFFEPIVEEEGLIGEGLAAETTLVALNATEGVGGVESVTDEPGEAGWLEGVSGTGWIGTEEVVTDVVMVVIEAVIWLHEKLLEKVLVNFYTGLRLLVIQTSTIFGVLQGGYDGRLSRGRRYRRNEGVGERIGSGRNTRKTQGAHA